MFSRFLSFSCWIFDGEGRVDGCCGFGAAYGSVSGSTRMPVVSLNGYFPPVGNVISTKNAVQPFSGVWIRATHVFGPLGVRTVL